MIKIDHPSKLNTAKRPERKKSSAAGESGFSNLLDSIGEEENISDSPALSYVAPPSALSSLSTLLSVQGISEELSRRQKHIRHAHLTLDGLEELRHALLLGEVPIYLLSTIEKRMSDIKQQDLPAALRDVIEEVELRAAVELAKLRMHR